MDIIKIKKRKKRKKIKKSKRRLFSTFGIGEEKEYFIENLAMLLASGMNILIALEAIQKEMRSKGMKNIIDDIKNDIDSGSALWIALEKTELFSAHVISLVRIGERSGRLTENLKVIVLSQRKDRVFKSKIRSAMMYPAMVLGLSLTVGIGIAWFILPRLATVFAQLKLELPFITKALITLGAFLGEYGAIVIPSFLAVLAILSFFIFIYKKTKHIGQFIIIKFPGVKRLIQEVELARAGFILGTLLEAGLPIVDALSSLASATTLRMYRRLYAHLKESIEEGNSFQASFEAYPKSRKLIPIPIQQMIAAGEQSGNLPETLFNIGQTFEAKTETTTKNLTVILEPILLVIVWLGVVAVALAVILPIYSLIGGLNESANPTTPTPIIKEVAPELIEVEEEIIEEVEKLPKLEILSTGSRNLNVRENSSGTGKIIGKVKTGEVYEYNNEEDGWYEIILSDSEINEEDMDVNPENIPEEIIEENEQIKIGWVSGDFVELLENNKTDESIEIEEE